MVINANIEVDEKLFNEAARLSDAKNGRELLNSALREFIESRRERNLFDIKGTVSFADGYDYKALRGDENGIG